MHFFISRTDTANRASVREEHIIPTRARIDEARTFPTFTAGQQEDASTPTRGGATLTAFSLPLIHVFDPVPITRDQRLGRVEEDT